MQSHQASENKTIAPQTYKAPNPYLIDYSDFGIVETLLYEISSFPNWLLGASLGRDIVFGKKVIKENIAEPLTEETIIKIEKEKPVSIQQHSINTHDDVCLDTVQLQYILNDKSDLHIIKFNGAGRFYETRLSEDVNDCVRLKATITAFNYRGSGQSTGTASSQTQLMTDGIAEVQRVLDQGVKPQNIILDGYSLGGCIASLVALHFHDRGIRVNLFNDRSIASFAAYITQKHVGSQSLQIQETYGKAVNVFSKMTNWELNATRAYLLIPDQYKGYLYIAEKSSDNPDNIGDGIVPWKATLHEAINNPADSPQYPERDNWVGQRNRGTHCYLMFAPRTVRNGHNAKRHELQWANHEGQTGQDAFEDFVKYLKPAG